MSWTPDERAIKRFGAVRAFTGTYAAFSNFYPWKVYLDRTEYPTVEHAFQAAKTLDKDERKIIRLAWPPGTAKRLGRRVALRPGWDGMRIDVMRELLHQKFDAPGIPRSLLAQVGGSELIEGNAHGDRFWGQVDGVGENWLGRLLMEIREEHRAQVGYLTRDELLRGKV